ncbi:Holliday junction branch migration protein RuvA [Flavobacteriaceae bacterium]|jgi:Holliday junction DNA helicase RuvA|nr:Holliday junction branch migration protein RuvA [Flavobacteriaceae bacterium]MBT5232773.1 Holliday junction branch migration protein RuvA [Flavobacteriaceae bacterium]MBT5493281.1 Holliday junction branch migration protein RuvA [Flavobacteriaceae bacterium]MBT7573306.1 Holliday junction branch migration protein RuvA [Flavobacteriaceae bacterium]MDA7567513.1 Holliday junction branch migration protein RuvA [Flavobacteriaceae bacterium]|tara:strand:+ start:2005 stop:2586 length:582 start_codon:yes stop_codon:yes gene_type:complete
MITQIKGRLVEKSPTELVIDCNGLGYLVNISLNTFSLLSDSENISLYTHLQVKEDSHTLFGFYEKTERNLFRKLISVSGIGASTARTMLSSLNPEEIQRAILSENVSTIQSVKGIGLKTAQRVIIELRDKVSGINEGSDLNSTLANSKREESLSALEVLGYSRKQTSKVVDKLISEISEISVEEIIKNALNKL